MGAPHMGPYFEGPYFEASWGAPVGACGASLGAQWVFSGPPLGPMRALTGAYGPLWVLLWGPRGPLWGPRRPLLGPRGPLWGPRGPLWGRRGPLEIAGGP